MGVDTAAGPTGDVRATSDITAGYSDMRLKEIKGLIDNALQRVEKLVGVGYEFSDQAKELGVTIDGPQVGLIAQDVEEALPEATSIAPFDMDVNGASKSGERYLTVQYEKIVPLLVQALKEQKEQIEYIRSRM